MSAPQVGDVITTAEQLEALPAWAGVVDGGGHAWVKFPEHGDWVCPEGDLMGPWLILEECDRPLTVAAMPGRPERVVKAEALREAAAEFSDDNGPSRTGLVLLDMADFIEATR